MIRRPLTTLACLGLLVVSGSASAYDLQDLRDAWDDGDFATARTLVDSLPPAIADSPEGLSWRIRLSTDPLEAERRLKDLEAHGAASGSLVAAARLDAAWLAWGRSDHQEARHLVSKLSPAGEDLPARASFLKGLSYLPGNDREELERAFKALGPDFSEYAWAQFIQGRLALSSADAQQAKRYFEAAVMAEHPLCNAEVLAARWEAASGADPSAAQALAAELEGHHPESLAWIRLQTVRRRIEALNRPAPAPMTPPAAPTAQPAAVTPAEARFAVQLGAYRSRESALEGLVIHQKALPDAEVIESRSRDGATWYKVVVGRHAERSEAEAALLAIRRDHVSDALITRLPQKP